MIFRVKNRSSNKLKIWNISTLMKRPSCFWFVRTLKSLKWRPTWGGTHLLDFNLLKSRKIASFGSQLSVCVSNRGKLMSQISSRLDSTCSPPLAI